MRLDLAAGRDAVAAAVLEAEALEVAAGGGDRGEGLFGWELENVVPADAPQPYFMARLRGGDVAAVTAAPEGDSATWNTYVWVRDADETAAAVRDAGGRVLVEPDDADEWGRMALFADPAGAVFGVWEPRGQRGAAIVNEHGSVNFNDLHTRDVDGAKAFYNAVFGWELLDTGGFSMWVLAGYGDFLEERNPGTRENMAAAGAPERFEDVVATVVAIEDDSPPRWGVTFAVDDADAIAARATELGGRVVLPPMDAPWTRMTVITDPQGATFVASQFKPENKDLDPSAGAAAGA